MTRGSYIWKVFNAQRTISMVVGLNAKASSPTVIARSEATKQSHPIMPAFFVFAFENYILKTNDQRLYFTLYLIRYTNLNIICTMHNAYSVFRYTFQGFP